MRLLISVLLLLLAVTTSITQNVNGGTTHFPNSADFFDIREENYLKEQQFFYFDTDLLEAISNSELYENILISPLSIKTTLTMILEGADGKSAKELKAALHLPDNILKVREQFRDLLAQFEKSSYGVKLKMANRLFLSDKLTDVKSYRNAVSQFYNANVTKVDFSNIQRTVSTINNWVNEQTHGEIPSLVNPGSFDSHTSLLITNALYFKGIWEYAFNKDETMSKCFYLLSGECQQTPMMDIVKNFKYGEIKHLDAKVIELPYSGGEYSMVILLPNKKDGVHRLAIDIRTSINTIIDDLENTEVYVSIPRFQIDYTDDIVKYLPTLHITEIIGLEAFLPYIVAEIGVRVNNILHKTRIKVNEEGTVAAAATGAVVIPLMGNIKPRFKADRPFLFYIRHIASKTIVFEGRLTKPEKAVQQQKKYEGNPQNAYHSANQEYIFPSDTQISQPQRNTFQYIRNQFELQRKIIQNQQAQALAQAQARAQAQAQAQAAGQNPPQTNSNNVQQMNPNNANLDSNPNNQG